MNLASAVFDCTIECPHRTHTSAGLMDISFSLMYGGLRKWELLDMNALHCDLGQD